MLILYGGSRSRAAIVRWYLEELGLAYAFQVLDMAEGEHLQAPFLQINPFGKVPVLTDGDFTLFESGAILLYLADREGHLPSDIHHRAIVQQWILFANSTLSEGLLNESVRDKAVPQLLNPLEQRLTDQDYLLENTFSVVDVAVGSVLTYIPLVTPLTYANYPALQRYTDRLSTRPAFIKGMLGQPI